MASRGGGSGRGRGASRGRGAGGNTGNQRGQAPLAAQLKQLERLQEPQEMAIIRRFKDLDVVQVRSVYGQAGLLNQEVMVPSKTMARVGQHVDQHKWISVLDATNLQVRFKAEEEQSRGIARREARLPKERSTVPWPDLTPEERRLCLLSQKDWNSFRAQQQGTKAESSASTAPTKAPAQGQGREQATPQGVGRPGNGTPVKRT